MTVAALLVAFFVAQAFSSCTVLSCEQTMATLASDFSCDSEETCRSSIAAQLVAIVPVDAEQEFARQKVVVGALLRERCGNSTFGCYDVAVFLASNDRARVPGGFDAMRGANGTLARYIGSIGPFCDVANGSCDSQEECEVQMQNLTCIRDLEHAKFEQSQVMLRWWYSLKRERAFLGRLFAACELQGGAACAQGVRAEIEAHDAAIEASRPSLSKWWRELMMTGSLQFTFPCGGKEPCLSTFVAPILAAKDSIGVTDAITRVLASFEPNSTSSAAFFADFVRNVTQPVPQCGFFMSDFYPAYCPAEKIQIRDLFRVKSDIVALVTESQVEVLESMFRACWLNCGLLRSAARAGKSAPRERNNTAVNVARYVRVLCDSAACLTSATETLQRIGFPLLQVDPFSDVIISKLFIVISMTLTCVLIAAGLVIPVLAVFVWKIASVMAIYLVILALSGVALILNLSAGVIFLNGGTNGDLTTAETLIGTAMIVLFLVLLVMSTNWFFAFFVIVRGSDMSARAEKVVVVCVAIFAVALIASVVGLGLDNIARQSRSRFSTVSSAVGLVVLKKAGVSSENALGLQKMLGVAIVLFVTTLIRTTNRLMLWHGHWYFPEWYWQGIDNIACYVLMMAALLYFGFSALHAKSASLKGPRETTESEMSQQLLANGVESDLDYDSITPKAYVI